MHKLNYLIELLIYINRLFKESLSGTITTYIPNKLIPVLDYIDNNLDNDLTLDSLEKLFYIDKFYLCKLF